MSSCRLAITAEPTRNLRRLFGTGWQELALVKQGNQVQELRAASPTVVRID